MRQVRRNVFETNSSSSHAISFSNSKHNLDYTQLVPDNDGVIHCRFDEFGWGYDGEDETNSAQIKLNYLVTQICETNDCPRPWCCEKYEVQEAAESVMETDDFKMLEEDIIHTLKKQGINAKKIVVDPEQEGYVDHQSVCAIRNVLPDECGTYSDFVFDKGYDLLIANDNAYFEEELMEVAQNNDSTIVKWLY